MCCAAAPCCEERQCSSGLPGCETSTQQFEAPSTPSQTLTTTYRAERKGNEVAEEPNSSFRNSTKHARVELDASKIWQLPCQLPLGLAESAWLSVGCPGFTGFIKASTFWPTRSSHPKQRSHAYQPTQPANDADPCLRCRDPSDPFSGARAERRYGQELRRYRAIDHADLSSSFSSVVAATPAAGILTYVNAQPEYTLYGKVAAALDVTSFQYVSQGWTEVK